MKKLIWILFIVKLNKILIKLHVWFLPLFHLVHFAQRAWVGLGVERSCLVGSDPRQGRSRRSRQTGRVDAWKCGMLWTQGPPIKHLWKYKTQM